MTRKESLINWLHRVEAPINKQKHSLDKRLKGIVTELFFEKYLPGSTGVSWPGMLSFGWAYGYSDRSRTRRRWFKISEGHRDGKVVGCKLLRQILSASPSDEFFLLQPVVSLSDALPSITWNVGEITLTKGLSLRYDRTTTAQVLESQLDDRTTNALKERAQLPVIETISPWLTHENHQELERLLCTRCLMNFGGFFLTDIDAVGITDEGGLEFLEFKRKYPAGGLKYTRASTVGGPTSIDQYLAMVESSELKGAGLRAELRNGERWKPHFISSFGLDTSHVRTVQLCLRADIKYQYIIWNSHVTELSDLLSFDFRPVADIRLETHYMTSGCFSAISFTEGKDSGTYSRNRRFQAMIPVESFISISIPRDAIAGACRNLD